MSSKKNGWPDIEKILGKCLKIYIQFIRARPSVKPNTSTKVSKQMRSQLFACGASKKSKEELNLGFFTLVFIYFPKMVIVYILITRISLVSRVLTPYLKDSPFNP